MEHIHLYLKYILGKRVINLKRGEITLSIGLIFMAVYAIVTSLHFPAGTTDGVPGAGYFPIIVSCFIIILSVIVIIMSFIKTEIKENIEQKSKPNIKGTLGTILATLLFLILWNKLHFIANSSIYIIILGILYGKKLKFIIPLSIVSSIIVYLIFSNVLNVMLTR
jgi:Tripartite tricarboxylate transporter TctB family.